MYISFLLVIAIIGALFYFLSPNEKRQTLGLWTYVTAILAFFLHMSTVHQVFGQAIQ